MRRFPQMYWEALCPSCLKRWLLTAKGVKGRPKCKNCGCSIEGKMATKPYPMARPCGIGYVKGTATFEPKT